MTADRATEIAKRINRAPANEVRPLLAEYAEAQRANLPTLAEVRESRTAVTS